MTDDRAGQHDLNLTAGRPTVDAKPSATAPLLVWLAIQSASLAWAAARLPLAAKYPQPAEMNAAALLVAAQILALSALFPFLCRTFKATAAVAVCSLPLLFLACAAAGQTARVVPVALLLVLWVGGLGLCRTALPGRWQHVLAAALTAFTAGGAILWYLRAEFVLNGELPLEAGRYSPMLAAINLAQGPGKLGDWATPAALCTGGVATVLVSRLRAKKLRTRSKKEEGLSSK